GAAVQCFLNSFPGASPQLPTDPGDATPEDACLELVLKVRIQRPKENDFTEVELNRGELSYQNLLKVSWVKPEQVKIRRPPNTLLRKDKDILRLQDFQEIKLVSMKNGSSELVAHAPSLTEKPCFTTATLQT
uniref:Uncharacterized protein n=1 Tax=Panthera tigris altaica TaxID=74533 RepID=A0A8C9KGM2_PANTA